VCNRASGKAWARVQRLETPKLAQKKLKPRQARSAKLAKVTGDAHLAKESETDSKWSCSSRKWVPEGATFWGSNLAAGVVSPEKISRVEIMQDDGSWKSAEVKTRKPAETPERESRSWCEKLFEMNQDRDRDYST
jgi:hypothetical protein